MGMADLSKVAAAVNAAESSGVLELVEMHIEDDVAAQLLARLDATQVTSMDLRGNELGNVSARVLAAMLAASGCTIKVLRLWSNCVGIDGVIAMALALEVNVSLETLDLGSQRPLQDGEVGDVAASVIAAALRVHPRLTSCDLRYNQMTDVGARALADALPQSASLRHLDLRYNSIGAAGLRALAVGLAAAEHAPQLRVYVKANAYGDHDAAALAEWLETDASLAPLAQGQERFWF